MSEEGLEELSSPHHCSWFFLLGGQVIPLKSSIPFLQMVCLYMSGHKLGCRPNPIYFPPIAEDFDISMDVNRTEAMSIRGSKDLKIWKKAHAPLLYQVISVALPAANLEHMFILHANYLPNTANKAACMQIVDGSVMPEKQVLQDKLLARTCKHTIDIEREKILMKTHGNGCMVMFVVVSFPPGDDASAVDDEELSQHNCVEGLGLRTEGDKPDSTTSTLVNSENWLVVFKSFTIRGIVLRDGEMKIWNSDMMEEEF